MSERMPFILILHPSREVLTHLVRSLVVLGHRIATTSESSEALIMSRHRAPDVFFVGLELEDRDSFELIEEFRSICPDTPVVALTPTPDVGTYMDVLSAGADDLLPDRCEEQALLWAVCRSIEIPRETSARWAS